MNGDEDEGHWLYSACSCSFLSLLSFGSASASVGSVALLVPL